MLAQRISMVTLGVRELSRARAFYEALGFAPAEFPAEGVAFFDMNGIVLGLYGHDALAMDAGVASHGSGFRGTAIALNLEGEAEVDRALAHAKQCGATITRAAQKTFWGGYSGYFADPDGHLWEIAFNPHAPLNDDGHMTLPPPRQRQ